MYNQFLKLFFKIIFEFFLIFQYEDFKLFKFLPSKAQFMHKDIQLSFHIMDLYLAFQKLYNFNSGKFVQYIHQSLLELLLYEQILLLSQHQSRSFMIKAKFYIIKVTHLRYFECLSI